MNSIRFLCGLFLCINLHVIAQTHKLTSQVLGGLIYAPSTEKFSETGLNERAFGGFKPGIALEIGGYFHFRRQMIVGAALGYWQTSKSHFSMSSIEPKLRMGYMFNHNPKFFYPYIFGGIGLSQLKFQRSHYSQVFVMSQQDEESKNVAVKKITQTYGKSSLNVPVPMLEVGLGLDIVTIRRWNIGMMATGAYYLARENRDLRDEYPANRGRLFTFSAMVGASYTILYRDSPKDINNFHAKDKYNKEYNKQKKRGANAAKNDAKLKELAHMHFPHTAPGAVKSKEITLSEAKAIHTIDKKNLDPAKNITVLGKVKGSITGNEVVVLTDANGKVLQKVNTKHGYFAYTNLKPDNYLLKFQNTNPNLKSEIRIGVDDPSQKISIEDFKKYEYKKISGDQFDNMVQGNLKLNASDKSAQDVSILLVNDKNEVVARTKANAKGDFAFQKLKADNYTALAESAEPNVITIVKVGDDDPSLRMTAAQLKSYRYHALNQELVDGAIVVGKITSANNMSIEDQSVFIVDAKGNVNETKTNAKGQFAFKNLTADDHQVYLQNPDPNIKVVAHPVDQSPEMMIDKDRMLKYNFNKLKGDDVANNVLLGKVNLKDVSKEAGDVEILLLDDAGKVVDATFVNKNGHFSFKSLRADNYKAVVNSPTLRIHAQMHAPVNDPDLMFQSDELSSYNPLTRKYEKLNSDDQIVVTGEITERGVMQSIEDHSVFLVDDAGKIAEVVPIEKDGSFRFTEQKQGNYQVLYETKGDRSYEHSLNLYKGEKVIDVNNNSYNVKKDRMVVHYEKGKENVHHADTSKFEHLVRLFRANPKAKVELKAFASTGEKDQDVQKLNMKRLEALRNRLIKAGVNQENIKVKDMGLPLQIGKRNAKEESSKIEIEINNNH